MILEKYLQSHPKKHIIFDLDDTLLTLKIDWSNWRKNLWKKVGTIDKKIVKQIPNKNGMGTLLYNETIIKHGKNGRNLVLAFCEKYELENLNGIILNKTLIDFVKKNYKKYNFYIWTSNNRKTTNQALKQAKLKPYFKKVITKEEVNLLKPHPDGFYLIFDEKNQSRKDYLFVGDSDKDKGATKNANIDFLRIKNK
jgi:HAD superfamily hydrolase (TIGR01549 family)